MRKTILAGLILGAGFYAHAQQKNWHHLDLKKDSVFGISTEKAYLKLLKNKKSTTVIVALIDNGIDTTHEALRAVIWTNRNEIASNQTDDDHNGFIDDLHGWNFIGTEAGTEDITRLVLPKKSYYDSLSYFKVPENVRPAYQAYRRLWNDYKYHVAHLQSMIAQFEMSQAVLESIIQKLGKPNPSVSDFKNYETRSIEEKTIRDVLVNYLPHYADFDQYKSHEVTGLLSLMYYHLEHGLKLDYTDTSNNVVYGNNDVNGPFTHLPGVDPFHGTHLAGIIGAARNDEVHGIANNVLIMPLRVMSFYRELRDSDLAHAIRYATDNGARIINMSFGKYYTVDKQMVDNAVKYAVSKGVLFVHAAGNDGIDLDKEIIYPNRKYDDDSGMADAWIEVGASGPKNDSTLVAPWSNYGKKSVDVFAPGVGIYSTTPGSHYASAEGTSCSAPLVAGLAALIWEYYPGLTAMQVRDIIMNSVVKVNHAVQIKDEHGNTQMLPFSSLCVSGGIVNAYNALKLATAYNTKTK